MKQLLADHIFSNTLRYEGHRLVFAYSDTEEPISIGGFLGAALLSVRLINSEEGELRGIPLDITDKQDLLFTRYEQEVLADDWGYLLAEMNQLNDAYIQLSVSEKELFQLCPNLRQLSLATELMTTYMQRPVWKISLVH
ncbi:MAG: hypothetical protein II452_01880 [Paludibacteraceae bacterium]|nr:hypothetical protein [Paludibacteraceae bacterium]